MLLTQFHPSPPSLATVAPGGTASSTQMVAVVVLTTCARDGLLEAVLPASPPYAATMPCVPTLKVLVLHAAVRELPVPISAAGEHPVSPVPASLKMTLPLGNVPATVAVKVTLVPAVDGFDELASAVVVGAGFCASPNAAR